MTKFMEVALKNELAKEQQIQVKGYTVDFICNIVSVENEKTTLQVVNITWDLYNKFELNDTLIVEYKSILGFRNVEPIKVLVLNKNSTL